MLGERGNLLQGSASKLAPLKRVVQQVRVSDVSDYSSATATDSEADRSVEGGGELPLLEEDRARLESLLVECFNSMDVKQIRMLKGVGAKR